MDVSLLIRQRLSELGLEQKDLAAAGQVTESYISQLLARKKVPPAPGRTDLYERIEEFLRLPRGELSRLAEVQRSLELRKKVAEPPVPLFTECRDLILRKCRPDLQAEMRQIFAKDSFGELERLVAQKLLHVAQELVRKGLHDEHWLRLLAQVGGLPASSIGGAAAALLEADIFHVSLEGCVLLLDLLIASWHLDLTTFGLAIGLNPRLAPGGLKRFEFVDAALAEAGPVQPGLEQFLKDRSLSGDATAEELQFLRTLRFESRRPSPLYYYRELQNLRDPLHFLALEPAGASN